MDFLDSSERINGLNEKKKTELTKRKVMNEEINEETNNLNSQESGFI